MKTEEGKGKADQKFVNHIMGFKKHPKQKRDEDSAQQSWDLKELEELEELLLEKPKPKRSKPSKLPKEDTQPPDAVNACTRFSRGIMGNAAQAAIGLEKFYNPHKKEAKKLNIAPPKACKKGKKQKR